MEGLHGETLSRHCNQRHFKQRNAGMRWTNGFSASSSGHRARLTFVAALCGFSLCIVGSAIAQTGPRKYVPRHERIAASILKSRGDRIASQPTAVLEGDSDKTLTGAPVTVKGPGAEAVATPVLPQDVLVPAIPGTQSSEPVMIPYPSDQGPTLGAASDASGPYEFGYSAPSFEFSYEPPTILQGDMGSFDTQSVVDDSCGHCGSDTCDGGCLPCGYHDACGPYCFIDATTLYGGVQGFKNATNRGQDGSFGFHEGFNWGGPSYFMPAWGMSAQLGAQIVHSNFNGAEFTTDNRTQYFVTAGLFKRSRYGMQGGLVFDYLKDEWYFNLDLGQVRGEISWGWPTGTSLGMQFATSVADDSDNSRLANQIDVVQDWRTHDWFTAFYRHRGPRQGEWRVYAGATTDSDGLIGVDLKIPLAGTFALEQSFTYLIPDEPTGAGGHREEAWNISLNLVWYPGRAVNGISWWHRPMFDVADNGTMIGRLQ